MTGPSEQQHHDVEEALLATLHAADERGAFHWQEPGTTLHWWMEGPVDVFAEWLAEHGWTPPDGRL